MQRKVLFGGLIVLGALLGLGLRDLWVYALAMGNDPQGKLNAFLRNQAPVTAAFIAAGVAAMLSVYGLVELYKRLLRMRFRSKCADHIWLA